MAEKFPNCLKCIHYYITYEPAMPYGCRAMKFKTARNPAQVVYSSSGMHCQLFKQKNGEKKETSGPH
jgi:hypothetical protein